MRNKVRNKQQALRNVRSNSVAGYKKSLTNPVRFFVSILRLQTTKNSRRNSASIRCTAYASASFAVRHINRNANTKGKRIPFCSRVIQNGISSGIYKPDPPFCSLSAQSWTADSGSGCLRHRERFRPWPLRYYAIRSPRRA